VFFCVSGHCLFASPFTVFLISLFYAFFFFFFFVLDMSNIDVHNSQGTIYCNGFHLVVILPLNPAARKISSSLTKATIFELIKGAHVVERTIKPEPPSKGCLCFVPKKKKKGEQHKMLERLKFGCFVDLVSQRAEFIFPF